MSGSTGANRIKKEDVEPTIKHYIKNVLSKWPLWSGKFAYTGSYVVGKKQDYGDIDIVILVNHNDKRLAKKQFAKWLVDNFKDKPELLKPFESSKHKGKLYYNSGELITIHYPQFGKDYGAQIDNMFALSDLEFNFKQEFLNLPAEQQGLILGLVKIASIENDIPTLFKKMNINKPLKLPQGFEYEFNLSSKELQLRKVQLDKNYKQISRTIEWRSQNWNDVKKLLSDYDLKSNFNSLLSKVKSNLKNKRSSKRIIGIFKSMVSVKSGEIGTEKGMNKIRAIQAVEDSLKENKKILSFDDFINQ